MSNRTSIINKRPGPPLFERLLTNRLVHEYENGKSWAALHPALGKIGWLQAKLVENSAP